MAVTASNSKINQASDKFKFKIFKMVAKSLRSLAIGVTGGMKKAAGNGRDWDVIPVGRLISGSRRSIIQTRNRRGQIKIKMFKMIAKSFKDLSIWVAGVNKKTAGNRGCNRRCFSSPATVIPIKQYRPKRVQIKNQDLKNDYWNSQSGFGIQRKEESFR